MKHGSLDNYNIQCGSKMYQNVDQRMEEVFHLLLFLRTPYCTLLNQNIVSKDPYKICSHDPHSDGFSIYVISGCS